MCECCCHLAQHGEPLELAGLRRYVAGPAHAHFDVVHLQACYSVEDHDHDHDGDDRHGIQDETMAIEHHGKHHANRCNQHECKQDQLAAQVGLRANTAG